MQTVPESCIDDFLQSKGQRLEPIRKAYNRVDQDFGDCRSRIHGFQRRSQSKKMRIAKQGTSDKSPVKSLRLSLPNVYTPGRKIADQLGKLAIDSPKRKRDDPDTTCMEEDVQSPTKRTKRENGEINPFLTCSTQQPPFLASLKPETDQMVSQSQPEGPAAWSSRQNSSKESPPHRSPSQRPITQSQRTAPCKLPSQLLSEEEQNRTVSPRARVTRQIPLCGTRRELFLDRKPWHEIDSRMQKHLARFKILLQSVEHPR